MAPQPIDVLTHLNTHACGAIRRDGTKEAMYTPLSACTMTNVASQAVIHAPPSLLFLSSLPYFLEFPFILLSAIWYVFFFPNLLSSTEHLTDSKVYVHELQTTLKCRQQPQTVWGHESGGDSFCCYTTLPRPSVPLLVLYLSSRLRSVYLASPPGVCGGIRSAAEGSVLSLLLARPSGTSGPLGLDRD